MSLHQGQAGGESCTLLRPPLPVPPKTLFPEHKLTGGSSGSGKDSLFYPAVMGCRFSLALGAVCPHPAVPALPRGSLRSGPGVTLMVSPFAVTAEPGASQPSARNHLGHSRCQFPDPISFLSLQLLRASLPLLQLRSGTAPGSLPKCLILSSCFPHNPLTASCPTFFHLPPLQTLLWSTEAI